METVANAFNLFINTDRNIPQGSRGDDVVIRLNQSPIVAGDDEHIRLTLDQFWMRKSWYDVNKNNNLFVVTTPLAEFSQPITLQPGDWSYDAAGFTNELATKISTALESIYDAKGFQVLADLTTYDETTEMYKITISYPEAVILSDNNLPVFQCLTSFGDAYKVVGGRRLVDGSAATTTGAMINSLKVSLNAGSRRLTIEPKYKIDLAPETHVYLAIDNQISNNIATNSFTAGNTQSPSADQAGMTASRIMAAIPVDTYNAHYSAKTDRLFFIDLASRVASSLNLLIVDSCGRRIPYVNNDAEQGVYGDRSFKCVIRVDIIKGNKTGTLQTMPTPKSVPPRFSSTPAPVLNLGIPGYGLNVPGQVYGDGYNPLAR